MKASDIHSLQQQIQNAIKMEFSTHSDHRCSDIQHSAQKLKIDTLSTFFSLKEAITQKSSEVCFRRSIFTRPFFLYCVVESPSVGLAMHFSFTLYNTLTDATKNPITISWFYTHSDIQGGSNMTGTVCV